MKILVLASSLGLRASVLAQASDVFEEPDFNVTKALLENGFNIAAIPEFSGLNEQDLLSKCSIACASLNTAYGPTQVLAQNTSTYTAFRDAYWSTQQASVQPHCVFKPLSAVQVSSLVLLSRLTQCPFAVKGGGHAAYAGASSIDGGITVSMENFRRVEVAEDKKTADIGPGNRWVDVYSGVEKAGVDVVGGRMAPVGVSGLILGGGISFFSNKLGWACDNVASYELVTASGRIIDVTPTSFPDLYWALRGGGNNFGIVTNFKLNAFPSGQMWGGIRVYTEENFSAILDAIHKFSTTGSATDTDAAEIVSFGFAPGLGKIAIVYMHYAKPDSNATIFSDVTSLPYIQSNTGLGSLADLVTKMNEGSVDGMRQTQWGASFRVDRDLFSFLVDTFFTLLPEYKNVEQGVPFISIQTITMGQLEGMKKNGGNALGLDAAKGPYFIMNMSSRWADIADDAATLKFYSTIIKKVKAEAQRRGLDNEYIYMNYASQFQDPISSYGAANLERLRAVSRKYDPSQVFQRLQPGHFKLNGRAPDVNMP